MCSQTNDVPFTHAVRSHAPWRGSSPSSRLQPLFEHGSSPCPRSAHIFGDTTPAIAPTVAPAVGPAVHLPGQGDAHERGTRVGTEQAARASGKPKGRNAGQPLQKTALSCLPPWRLPPPVVQTYGSISHWDVSKISDFSWLFCASTHNAHYVHGCRAEKALFNSNIASWNVSHATNMDCKPHHRRRTSRPPSSCLRPFICVSHICTQARRTCTPARHGHAVPIYITSYICTHVCTPARHGHAVPIFDATQTCSFTRRISISPSLVGT